MPDRVTSAYEDLPSARYQHDSEHPEYDSGVTGSSTNEVSYPRRLLDSLNLRGRGNGTVRADVLHQAQRTHGNRAVQRSMQHSSGVTPVQRYPGIGDNFDMRPMCPLFMPGLQIGCKPLGRGGGGGGDEPAKPVPQPGKKEKKKPVKAKPPVREHKKGHKPSEEEHGGGGGLPWLLPPLGRNRGWPYGGGLGGF